MDGPTSSTAQKLHVPLKHARTEVQFGNSHLNTPKEHEQEGLPGRFDSHNLLRSDENPDLVGKSNEEIWLRRDLDEKGVELVAAMDFASVTPTIRQITPSTASPAKLSDVVHPYNYNQTAKFDENSVVDVDQDDGTSIHSSIPSRSVSKKSHKSLTRRLSGFLSRSFRRKRRGVSYVVDRPDSSATQRSDEMGPLENQQQMLRLGFSLDIEEALKNEPDSFLFVSLTDSGYFSSNFEEFEKLPQNETLNEDSEDVDMFSREKPSHFKPSPRNMNPRRLSFVEGTSVVELMTNPHYSLSSDYLGQARPAKQKLKFKKHPWKWIKSKF